ncbi:MAG: hypothetical protein IIB38_16840 [Candidatus Hydrogenedentes bacterium]|nr:hypothetical protein [Candidatus Hydrogenedentota bacterium]
MTLETIGSRIKQKRIDKGWTRFQLSLAVATHPQNVFLWEEKGRTPNAKEIPGLARELDTSPNYLLTGKEKFA